MTGWKIVSIAAALLGLATSPALADDPDDRCVDAVVVAKILRQEPTEVPLIEDAIVMSWPWRLTLEIEQEVLGKRRLPRELVVSMTLHSNLRQEIQHGLFFLRRSSGGAYAVQYFELPVAEDESGRFALLLEQGLEGADWAPDSADQWRRPVRYRAAQLAWWDNHDDESRPLIETSDGVLVTDIPAMLEAAGVGRC